MRHTLTAGAAVLLLWSQPAHAVVTCTNENTAVQASTPTTDFTLQVTDGTVTHTPTGLVWMRCSLGQTWDGSTCTGTANLYEWQPALQEAQDVNSGASNADNDNSTGFAGKSDWRLPNRTELYSIVENRCWSPAINAAAFPNTPASGFWTSTSVRYSISEAFITVFSGGNYGRIPKQYNSYHVRLVRGGP